MERMENRNGHDGAWERLGTLLQQRRALLNPRWRNRKAFAEDAGLSYRMIFDIEENRRTNFTTVTLTALEVAYELKPGSIAAYLDGGKLALAEDKPPPTPVPAYTGPAPQSVASGFPWTPDGRFLSADELADAAPEATVFLAAVNRAQDLGLNPDDLDGSELFPDDPGRALAWDTVSQWPWQYGIWMAARGLRKAQAARGRQNARRRSELS